MRGSGCILEGMMKLSKIALLPVQCKHAGVTKLQSEIPAQSHVVDSQQCDLASKNIFRSDVDSSDVDPATTETATDKREYEHDEQRKLRLTKGGIIYFFQKTPHALSSG
jgi:hypothetical protein